MRVHPCRSCGFHRGLSLGLTQALIGAGRGIFFPVLMALSIQAVPSSERATAMGVFQALYAVGMLLGPLLLGFLADGLGLDSVFYVSAALGVICAAASFAPAIARLGVGPTAAPPAPE